MRGAFYSAPDPYVLNDSLVPPQSIQSVPVGLTVRSLAINTAIRNLVLITAGQSYLCNTNTTLFTPTNNTVVDNFSIYDGAAYNVGGPMLGCTNNVTNTPGNASARVADLLITNGKFDRVIVVPIAVGGTIMTDWSVGALSGRFAVAMRRLAARGIIPGATGVTFALLFDLGPTDGVLGTTQAAWTASFNTFYANCVSAGFSGRTFVDPSSWYLTHTYPVIRAAQAAVCNGATIFAGGDSDTLTGATNRSAIDNEHLTDTGAASHATLIYNAMHASGTPY